MGIVNKDPAIGLDAVKAMREKYLAAEAEYNEICDAYAASACPFAIGDVVWITHYSYAGRKMRVERISLKYSGFRKRFRWVAYGVVQKKDGGDSQLRTEINEGYYDPNRMGN